MRRIFMVILIATLPAFAATPVFAHVDDDSPPTVDTGVHGPFAARRGGHPAGGFGRFATDSLIECFGGCDAGPIP